MESCARLTTTRRVRRRWTRSIRNPSSAVGKNQTDDGESSRKKQNNKTAPKP